MHPQRNPLILVAILLLIVVSGPALSVLASGLSTQQGVIVINEQQQPAPSVTPEPGFLLPTTRTSTQSMSALYPGVLRTRTVEVNFGVLPQTAAAANASAMDTVTFNLFPDAVFTGQKLRIEPHSTQRDGYVWVGTLPGDEYSQIVLTVGGGLTEAFVRTRGAFYQITAAGDGLHAVNQIDLSAFVSQVDDSVPAPPLTNSSAEALPPAAQVSNLAQIDYMVVYTGDVLDSFGGDTNAVNNAIEASVAATNQSYLNSGVNARLKLVHMAEVSYTESGNMNTDLDRVTLSDGFLDNVLTLRNTHAADLVTLITNTAQGNICGLGWLMTPPGSYFAPYGYNVVLRSCLPGGITMAHELGHNMGAAHNLASAGGPGAYPYSYGYIDPEGRFRTIMSYFDCSSPCPAVYYFSNTTRTLEGRALGNGSANNALTFNNTAPIVAAFRNGNPVSIVPTNTPPPGGNNPPTLPAPTSVPGCMINVAAGDSAGLVSAITAANNNGFSNDTICLAANSTYTFASGPYSNNGSNALPIINNSIITILGNGATITRSGSAQFRFFTVGGLGALHLNGVRITNGRMTSSFNIAGAILNFSELTIANSELNSNVSDFGGGIYNLGDLTITDSVLAGNSAYQGGAVYADNNGNSAISLLRTNFRQNVADGGGAIYVDVNSGTLTLGGSCFIGNNNIAVDRAATSTTTINAEYVWWNSGNGPSLIAEDGSPYVQAGDVVTTGEVNIAGFLTAKPSYCLAAASPAGAAPQRNYYTVNDVMLSWARVTWALDYEIQVANDPGFANLVSSAILPPNTLEHPVNDLPNSTYYWRVRARVNAATWGNWSAVDTFIVDVPE